ncbi:MAG: hypothetical protein U0X20_12870 [Caldilineaceae bacterium]
MPAKSLQTWDLWYPQAAASGLSFGRGRIDGADTVLVHAAPKVLAVKVYDGDILIAQGNDLQAAADTPIARLTRKGDRIERADIWPTAEDIGSLVLLSGGEVGTLRLWWHAPDHSEWRWQIELYNKRSD